jgi:hypothetical protein
MEHLVSAARLVRRTGRGARRLRLQHAEGKRWRRVCARARGCAAGADALRCVLARALCCPQNVPLHATRRQALDIAVDVCFWLDLLLCFRTGACCAHLSHTHVRCAQASLAQRR